MTKSEYTQFTLFQEVKYSMCDLKGELQDLKKLWNSYIWGVGTDASYTNNWI